jgi:hypothetical protein
MALCAREKEEQFLLSAGCDLGAAEHDEPEIPDLHLELESTVLKHRA